MNDELDRLQAVLNNYMRVLEMDADTDRIRFMGEIARELMDMVENEIIREKNGK